MSPEKAFERFHALLARTSSSHEEEARTCAYLACKIMLEYGFTVQAPVDTRTGAERARDMNRAYRAKAKAKAQGTP